MEEREKGTVVSSGGGLYEVRTPSGVISCKPRGKFRYEKLRLLVGDRVTVFKDELGNPCVDEIHPRKNELLRPPMANLDRLFIVCSAAKPDPIALNVDKLTAVAVQNRIEPVIVVSKCDLDGARAAQFSEIYEKAGFKVFVTSVKEETGLSELRGYLENECRDEVSAFAGASGAGKSTLLNALFPDLRRATTEVSRIGRGRHTTRSVDLFPAKDLLGFGKGFIADTPGFTLLDFENFDLCTLEDLPYDFPEFVPCLGKCRYTKCTHRKEEGCAVIEEVRCGNIPASRHDSYRILYDQLKDKRPWDK